MKSATERARPGRPTAAEKLGVEPGNPPKLPGFLNNLEERPAELILAQRLYLQRVVGRMSYHGIAEKSASVQKLGKLSVGTVYNYIQAYAKVANKYADDEPVRDEIRFCEEEIARLVRKRKRTKILADDLKLTREIREYADMIQGLKGVKQPAAPQVVVQQNTYASLTPEKAVRIFDIMEEKDAK